VINFTATFTKDNDLWHVSALGGSAAGESPTQALGALLADECRIEKGLAAPRRDRGLEEVREFVSRLGLPHPIDVWNSCDADEVCVGMRTGLAGRVALASVNGLVLATTDAWKKELRETLSKSFGATALWDEPL
jgi:hypothetical protein